MRFFSILVSTLLLLSCSQKVDDVNNSIYVAHSESFWEYVNRDATFDTLAIGHDWTEGPVWVKEINSLLFSDVPRNIIYSWNEEQGKQEYLKPSGYTGEGYR